MRLPSSLLLSAFLGAASALSDANVYIFEGGEAPITSNPPTLSPEQARLVLAQRLDISDYHSVGEASESTISYISQFGGYAPSLFQNSEEEQAAELVLIVEGVSTKTAGPLLDAWSSRKPSFTISNPPSMIANKRLVSDLHQQSGQVGKDCPLQDAINPFNKACWNRRSGLNRRSKLIYLDLAEKTSDIGALMGIQERLIRFADKKEMNVVVVLMPESSRTSKSISNPYGTYEKASQSPIGRRQVEEPMTEDFGSNASPLKQLQTSDLKDNSTDAPITGVPPACYSSLNACTNSTNNCSGHGECYKKYGTGDSACFACGCRATNTTFTYAQGSRKGWTITYWGGAACQKKDVSSAFWLIAIFTVVMVGIVSWGIGMLFSIGEEKLPGVIGAGVSSKSK